MIARSSFPLEAHPGAVRGQPPAACNPREPAFRVSQTRHTEGAPATASTRFFPVSQKGRGATFVAPHNFADPGRPRVPQFEINSSWRLAKAYS
jgi:hypothetical protein